MKYQTYTYQNDSIKLLIEEDVSGCYLYIFRDPHSKLCTEDYHYETLDELFRVLEKNFGVTKNQWKFQEQDSMDASTQSSGNNTNSLARVWSMHQIWIASFLAGPIGGCYLLSKNYKILGKEANSKRSLIIGTIATIALLFVSGFFEIPKGFPRFLIPMTYTLFIWSFAKNFQEKPIKELLDSGAKRSSYSKLALISISFLFLEFILGYTLLILSSSAKTLA